MPGKSVTSESENSVLGLLSKAAPPAFTVPVLGFKSFMPSLTAVFVLGFIFAIAMFFYAPKMGITGIVQRISVVLMCLAWLLIIDEVGADEIFSKYILNNSVDDHTYVIRFSAGLLIVVNFFVLAFAPKGDDPTTASPAPATN